MKVPLKSKANEPKANEKFSPDSTQRAVIALEAITTMDYKRMAEVLKAIHDTADDRGGQIKQYLDEAKNFYAEMKELA